MDGNVPGVSDLDERERLRPTSCDRFGTCGTGSRCARRRSVRTAVAAVAVLLLPGCGTMPPTVATTPGSTATPVVMATPTYSSLKIEIIIDAQTVQPLDKEMEVERGRPVVLVTHTDHDTALLVRGPGLDRTIAVGRKTTITSSFVALEPGVITIRSDDPVATIATLTVR